jgi:putative membrane protein
MQNLTTTCFAAGLIGMIAGHANAALSSADSTFATKAASGGLAEIQAAQQAQQKSTSPQVKTFANQMIADHTKANNELQQIAQQQKLTLPTQPTAHDRASVQAMGSKTGANFDRGYAQEEVRDHQQDISLFEQEAKSGRDPALKQYAQETLPTLRHHLEMAQTLNTGNQK